MAREIRSTVDVMDPQILTEMVDLCSVLPSDAVNAYGEPDFTGQSETRIPARLMRRSQVRRSNTALAYTSSAYAIVAGVGIGETDRLAFDSDPSRTYLVREVAVYRDEDGTEHHTTVWFS